MSAALHSAIRPGALAPAASAALNRLMHRLQEHLSFRRVVGAAVVLCIVLFALGWASRENPAEKPYLEIKGGGFIFNYRIAEVFYGFTALVNKPLEIGSIVEATFQDPSGGDPITVSQRVDARTTRYTFRTPPLHGVVAQKPYHVSIRIYDRQRQELIWQTERDYKSDISDTVVPEKPLTIGPGYTRNR